VAGKAIFDEALIVRVRHFLPLNGRLVLRRLP